MTADLATAVDITGGENTAELTSARNATTIKAWETVSVDGERGVARNLKGKNATTSGMSQLTTTDFTEIEEATESMLDAFGF